MGETVWVGVDVGRHGHPAAAVNAHDTTLWSRRIRNDQSDIETVLERVADAESVVWAIDMTAPESALLRGVLTVHRQQVRYVPGRVVHSMTGAFAGEGKTDLLTELPCRPFRRCVRGSTGLARFVSHDQRQGRAARVVRTGGPGAGVARGDGRSVRAVSTR
ncbi:IS110 family transposase [Rhodococcus erythropolis]|uniref:IS110 family transposase n=1 Tax=Rhodococcus erythropolis TaxID=1833 RepID=UPI003013F472